MRERTDDRDGSSRTTAKAATNILILSACLLPPHMLCPQVTPHFLARHFAASLRCALLSVLPHLTSLAYLKDVSPFQPTRGGLSQWGGRTGGEGGE